MSPVSPLATGGAGPRLEFQVAAYYLVAILTGGAVRGLGEVSACRVGLQRAFDGRPLDDLAAGPGGPCRLDLQVKRTLPFGEGSRLLHEVVGQCWRTFAAPGFRRGSDRFGAAVGQRIPLIETAGHTALAWAHQSADAAEYLRRIGTRCLASDGTREFVRVMRAALDAANGGPVTDAEALAFLQHLRFLRFDFELDDASGERVEVADRLRAALAPEQADRAGDLWCALVEAAAGIASAAGIVDRPALLELLAPHGFLLAPQRQLQPVLDRVAWFSSRVLSDIEDTVGGVRIGRDALVAELEEKVAESGYVEIVGEPGAGKSALLKALAERRLAEGPVLVVSAGRMPRDPGWEGLARHLRIAADLRNVLAELGTSGSPCLFIDGLDRFEDAGAWAAINDIVRAVRAGPAATRWTIGVAARANNVGHYSTRLASEARSGGEARVHVGGLTDGELDAIAAAHPSVGPIVRH